jgi:chromosome segregation ATPase
MPSSSKEEDAVVATAKKQLERERKRIKERDEEITKLRKEMTELKEQKAQFIQSQIHGSRKSFESSAASTPSTELAGLTDLKSKLELLESQLVAKNKQIEQLEQDARPDRDRMDQAPPAKSAGQLRVVQQQLEDAKKALDEERLAAQRLAKKEKELLEEIRGLKTKRMSPDDGLDEASLRKRKDEFEMVRPYSTYNCWSRCNHSLAEKHSVLALLDSVRNR